MQAANLSDISLGQLSDSILFKRKASFIISFFTFFTCLSSGIFFSLCISSDDSDILVESMNKAVESGSSAITSTIAVNLFLLILIFIAGLSVYGFIFSFIILAVKSIAFGFTYGLTLNLINPTDLKALAFSLMPSSILLSITFILAVSISSNYAISVFTKNQNRTNPRNEYIIIFIVLTILVIISAFLENILL